MSLAGGLPHYYNLVLNKLQRDFGVEVCVVVPTEKGAMYACKFIRTSKIAASSTECRIKMNINMAHCLLTGYF